MDVLTGLPFEIVECILGQLSVSDLLSCSLVSKSWRFLANSDFLWKPFCLANQWDPKLPSANGLDSGLDEDINNEGLVQLCPWRQVYNWYSKLNSKWRNQQSVRFELRKSSSPVYSMDCNGSMLVSGHQDGNILIWDITTLPLLKQQLSAAIPELPVTSIKTDGEVIVAVQKRLLGMFKRRDGEFRLFNATSLDINDASVKVHDVITSLGDSFSYWYTENLRFKEVYYPWKLNIILQNKIVYTLNQSRLYKGNLESSEWTCYPTNKENLCDLLSYKESVYVVSQKTHTYISHVGDTDFQPAFHVLGSKKIIVSGNYFIGTPHTGDGYLKKIWVWDEEKDFASVSRTIPPGAICAVSPRKGIVVFSASRQILVWDVVDDCILNVIYEGAVAFMTPAFTRYLLILTHRVLFLTDWKTGRVLYVVETNLDWIGDFKNLLWLNHDSIVVGGLKNQLQFISYR